MPADWYLEIMNPMGHWSPQLWADRPSVQTIHGTDYLRSTGGHSPRVRAVQEVPGHLAGAGLKTVQAALSPDRVEVAVAAALEGTVECGEGHKCPIGPHGACCGHPTAQADPVTLTYRNWRGEVSDRTITPRRVWFGSTEWHPEPQWLLSAWDAGKDAERDFALADFLGRPGEREALVAATFQLRVQPWMNACFGPEISADRLERGDRLLEEVLELLQSGDYPPERVAALTGYVWSRDKGEPAQEVGGVMVTLAAYCLAHGMDMHDAGETELARVWTKVEKIRAKQAAKPTGSALPQEWPQTDALAAVRREARAEGMRKAARIAREACLVPPDGGSPTEEERLVCEAAERYILAAAEKEAGHD